MNGGWLLPLHAGLGASLPWFERLLAIVLVGGLWLSAAGFAERWQARQRPGANTGGDRETSDGEISSRRQYLRVRRASAPP